MTRKALLIGSQIIGLEGPHNDVSAIRGLLEKQGFVRTEIIECIAGQATRDGILKAYRALIDRTQTNDVVVVYYSGHGGFADDRSGRRVQYILPTDWVDNDDVFRGIVDAELSDLLDQLTAKTTNAPAPQMRTRSAPPPIPYHHGRPWVGLWSGKLCVRPPVMRTAWVVVRPHIVPSRAT